MFKIRKLLYKGLLYHKYSLPQDYVSLKGEVYFPNLTFEKNIVDFGCILNDTEVTRYVNITNNSPMPVKYKWSFLAPSEPIVIYPQPIPDELFLDHGKVFFFLVCYHTLFSSIYVRLFKGYALNSIKLNLNYLNQIYEELG